MDLFARLFSFRQRSESLIFEGATPPVRQVAVHVDRPIQSIAEDIFDRAPFAAQIANIIAKRVDPSSLVLALYGPWGDGKTSTLAMIKEYLEPNTDILTMDYNPWFYGANTEAITRSFFYSIKSKLEKSGWFSRDNVGELMATYGGAIPKVGDAVQSLGEAITTEALIDTRDKVGNILRKHGKKIVVFIDDIDRLDRAEIQTLFKLVRLSGGFDHTTYVLAFDDNIVAEALGEAYGAGDPVAGRRFLEKIVQVPLHLPPVDPEKLRKLMFEACDRVVSENDIELREEDGAELGNSLAHAFGHALKTPRQVKLFENAITFAVPLLKGEVRLVDQIQIEALRIFYPLIYEAVRRNPDHLLRRLNRDGKDDPISPVDQALEQIEGGEVEKDAAREFLGELFPRYGQSSFDSDWDSQWAEQKRICSRDYFRRYFTYTVPTGDMPDLAVDSLIAKAVEDDVAGVGETIASAFRDGAGELLIRKLRGQERTLDLAAAPVLISEISSRASTIPTTRDIFFGSFVFTQAAAFITRLIARGEIAQQDQWLTKAAEYSDSVPFVAELIRMSVKRTQSGEGGGFLSAKRIEPIVDILLRRFMEPAAEGGVFKAVGDHLGMVLFVIQHTGSDESKDLLKKYLADVIAADPSSALILLKAFAGRTQGGNGAIGVSDFDRGSYRKMSDLLNLDHLYAQLNLIFGKELDKAEWRDDWDAADVDRRIADQFSYLHHNPEVC